MSHEKIDAVNNACGHVSRAKIRAWNNFCALHNDTLHVQPEVHFLNLDLETLHEIRGILQEHPDGNEEVVALLECLRDTIFRNITNCIFAVTEAASQYAEILDDNSRTSIKHDVEGALIQAAHYVRRAFVAFDMEIVTEAQL